MDNNNSPTPEDNKVVKAGFIWDEEEYQSLTDEDKLNFILVIHDLCNMALYKLVTGKDKSLADKISNQ